MLPWWLNSLLLKAVLPFIYSIRCSDFSQSWAQDSPSTVTPAQSMSQWRAGSDLGPKNFAMSLLINFFSRKSTSLMPSATECGGPQTLARSELPVRFDKAETAGHFHQIIWSGWARVCLCESEDLSNLSSWLLVVLRMPIQKHTLSLCVKLRQSQKTCVTQTKRSLWKIHKAF